MPETIYLLLGSNQGDRERNLERAMEKIDEIEGIEIIATSAIYISEAQDMEGENPTFLNQVVKADYLYTPHELLHTLEAIEVKIGRKDKGQNLPRPIDLDILFFGTKIINQSDLIIPHPEILNRPFVMVPLLEIDPDLCHPANRKQIASFLSESEKKSIIVFKDHVARNV